MGHSIQSQDIVDGCIQERDEIVSELSKMFPNANKRSSGVFEYGGDPSGESIIYAVYFELDSGGEIEVSCNDYEETNQLIESIRDRRVISYGLNEKANYSAKNTSQEDQQHRTKMSQQQVLVRNGMEMSHDVVFLPFLVIVKQFQVGVCLLN